MTEKSPLIIDGVPRWVREKRLPTEDEHDEWDEHFGPVRYVGLCDDCADPCKKSTRPDKTLKQVRRIDGDGIAFCRMHWERQGPEAGPFEEQ